MSYSIDAVAGKLSLPCMFGVASVDASCSNFRITVRLDRRIITLTQADFFFCCTSLHGYLHRGGQNDLPDQKFIPEAAIAIDQIESWMDVRKFTVSKNEITFSVSGELPRDPPDIRKFARRSGRLVVKSFTTLVNS